MRQQIWWLVYTALVLSAIQLTCDAQVVIKDQFGAHLFIQGTSKSDLVLIWEESSELFVSVNGATTNVTKASGVNMGVLHSVGVNLLEGDDIVSYQTLRKIPGGTKTNGGPGNDIVLEGNGVVHRGVGIESWVSPDVKEELQPDSDTPMPAPDVLRIDELPSRGQPWTTESDKNPLMRSVLVPTR